MAAPEGNQFWKLRSKHGRDKLFESPNLVWGAACEYFQWCVDNPLMSIEQSRGARTKKDTEITQDGVQEVDTGLIELPKMRPFTWEGVAMYCHCDVKTLRNYGKEDEKNKDFLPIITRIREVVYRQKFEGAAAGFFNSNIIARDLGLSDKKDVTTSPKPPEIEF